MIDDTRINKAIFIAQYWLQPVLSNVNWNERVVKVDFHLKDCYSPYRDDANDYFLLLTSLSNVNKKDAIEVAKILDPECKHGKPERILGVNFNSYFDINETAGDIPPVRFLYAFRYLRSKGYAIPFMGLNIEEQIKRGWIKLKQK